MKILKYSLIVFGCIAIGIIGIFAGYNIFKPDKIYVDELELVEDSQEPAVLEASLTTTPSASFEKIMSTTNIVYEYYYTEDGKTERTEEEPPYFLLNLTEKALADKLSDWEILSFSTDEVVLRKNVSAKSDQHYIVSDLDGYVAVFYETPINGTRLKEMTNTPIIALSQVEQNRLKEGIYISGKEELIKILEDYGS